MNMTISRYSEASGLSEDRIRHLIREHGFPAVRVGRGYLVNDMEADAWFRRNAGRVISGREWSKKKR